VYMYKHVCVCVYICVKVKVNCVYVYTCVCVYIYICEGKARPRTGHEGPEGGKMHSSTLSLTWALDEVGR